MKVCKVGLIVLLLSSGLECLATPSRAGEEGWRIDQRNLEALINSLRPALQSAGGTGRLYFYAPCHAGDEYVLPFPRVDVQSPSKHKTGLAAVRDVFKNDKRVSVTEDRTGMIRIWIGKPSIELLKTRIGSLTLSLSERYNALEAIMAIENTKEFKAAMRQLGFKAPLTIIDMNLTPPEKGLPHLSKALKDMTVDAALDVIAKKFGGLVFYGACENPNGERFYRLDLGN